METPRRDFLFVGCEAGHAWRSMGGCNAGCSKNCCCSVPVKFCERCDDCDYGDNVEAEVVRQECAMSRGKRGERHAD